jgi:membrane-associated phospholipid phosphatase
MGICRVITVVHRPSDILGGFILGVLVPLILAFPLVFIYFKRWLITPLVRFQEWMFGWFERR